MKFKIKSVKSKPNYTIGKPVFEKVDNYWKCKVVFTKYKRRSKLDNNNFCQKLIIGYGNTKVNAFHDALWLQIDLKED